MWASRTSGLQQKVTFGYTQPMLSGWYRDVVLALRSLRKNPVLSLTAVLTLALGIGANTAIFTLLYGLVLRSLPTQDATGLVRIGTPSAAEPDSEENNAFMPYRMLQGLREEQSSFRNLSVWSSDQALIKDKDGSVQGYLAVMVSGNAFDVLRIQPYRGRLIAPYDDVRGGPPAGWPVVLSYGFWSDFYNRAPDIVGKQIKISDVPVTVVGIALPYFHGVWPGEEPKMYLPFQFAPVLVKQNVLDDPDSVFGGAVIGRLKPGVSLAQANAELAHLQKSLFDRFIPAQLQHDPYVEKAYLKASSARSGLPTYVSRTYSKPLYLMQGLVAAVLVLCCVNIGGLMVSRVAAREREFAVRTAVGASPMRLVLQYLTESFVIAIAAWYGSSFLLRFFRDPMMFELMSVHPDQSIFWMTGVFAVLTTLLSGTLPAWRAARTDPGLLLKARNTLGGRRRIAGRMFVPIQVAMSLVLVVLATLLSQSVIKLRNENTGFDLDHVTIQTSPLYLLPQKGDAKLNLYQRIVDRLMEMPGVDAAAATSQTPMTGEKIVADFQAVADGPNPPEQALGRYVRSKDSKEFADPVACRVIGLAEDAKFSDIREGPPRTIYLPLSTKRIDNLGNLVFLIHSRTKAQAVAAFRKTLGEVAPTVPLVIFVTLREQMDAALGSQELITLLANFFGVLVLLLSALGLYGLLSAGLAQRTSELGVRMALGATRGMVLRMVLREAFGLLILGLLLGTIALLFTTRFILAMLYGVSAYDPSTLAGVAGTLVMVTVLAAMVPALRAATTDPIEALRAD